MEKYLPYCLASLLVDQNRDAFEVLIVNDGSKDRTLAIANDYALNYPELFRVIDKKNGNYGSCINVALPLAEGKYVKILDADDSFDTSNFSEFLAFLDQTAADLVLSDIEVVDENRRTLRTLRYGFPLEGTAQFTSISCNPVFIDAIQMHAVAYRRQILLDIDYHQTEGISYTDQQWIFTPMAAIATVAYFDKTVYQYLVGREGQTMDPKVKSRSMEHARKNSFGLVSDYEKHKRQISDPKILVYLRSRLKWYLKDIYVFYISNNNKSNEAVLRDYDAKLKDLSPEVYELIGRKDVSSIAGFAYIEFWRKHRIPTAILKIVGSIYRSVLNVRSRKATSNANLTLGN